MTDPVIVMVKKVIAARASKATIPPVKTWRGRGGSSTEMPIHPGTPRTNLFKIKNLATNMYWSGLHGHDEIYSSEGKSWITHERAQKALLKFVSPQSRSMACAARMRLRLQEIREWRIVETEVVINDKNIFEYDQEFLGNILGINILAEHQTLGNHFENSMSEMDRNRVEFLYLLPDKRPDDFDLKTVVQDVTTYRQTRNVVEIYDRKSAMLIKLSCELRAQCDVATIRANIMREY